MSRIRQTELKARRIRRVKLKKLKEAYIAAKTKAAKEKIIEKASRVAPSLTEERFVEIAE